MGRFKFFMQSDCNIVISHNRIKLVPANFLVPFSYTDKNFCIVVNFRIRTFLFYSCKSNILIDCSNLQILQNLLDFFVFLRFKI